MTGLIIAGAIALLIAAGIMLASRLPLRLTAPVATALLLGLAGYAWQGNPGLAGTPIASGKANVEFDEALAKKRTEIGERISSATKWLVISDAFARQGKTQEAANVLLSGLRENPKDANLWVGMGNALLIHGGGALSPAANFAFQQALQLDPKGASPAYFYGLAMAESGQFEQSREMWLQLAARLPEGNELREELIRNVALINMLIERRDAAQQGGNPPG